MPIRWMAASFGVSPEAGASAIRTFLTASAVRNHACDGVVLLSHLLMQGLPSPRDNMLESCLPHAFVQGISRGFLQEQAVKFSSCMHFFVVFLFKKY